VTGRRGYRARWVLPISAPPIPDGVVVVDGERIAVVGSAATVADTLPCIDLGDAVLLPGLVNAHSHLELTAMRGLLEGLEFRDWLRMLTVARRDVFDPPTLLDASLHGLHEGLRHGITTYADTTESGVPLEAMRLAGVRGIGYLELFGPDPAQCEASVADARARVAVARASDTARVKAGVSPHAPYTVSTDLFRAVADWVREDPMPLAVHIAESTAEHRFVAEGAGPFAERLRERRIAVQPSARSPIALLEATGILDARPLLIHAIRADEADLAAVARAGASIVHCPISNAKLGHGIAPLDRMLAHGIPTGLGTDSVASNDRMDLLGEARQAVLLQGVRLQRPDPLTAHDVLRLATLGGAEALGLGAEIGSLTPGKLADLAAFPLSRAETVPLYDPAVALVHILAGAVTASLVLVGGVPLVRDGVVLGADPGLPGRLVEVGARLADWRSRADA
jgi:5-methylthioadenosine/S-adenosylhomocysteine deaminase